MKQIGVLPFRIGCSVTEIIPNQGLEFYKWLTHVISDEECEIYSNGNTQLHTIPISINNLLKPKGEIEVIFGIKYSEYKNEDIIVVDIKNQYKGLIRATYLLHIAHCIATILDQYKEDNQLFILLLPEYLPEEDIIRKTLEYYINNDMVIIIDENGGLISSNNTKYTFDVNQYVLKMINASESNLKLFERKLIKRLGHFHRVREDGSEYCNRYFFDGSLCEKELPILIREYIENKNLLSPSIMILYHCPMSPWVEDAILTLSIRQNINTINLNELINDNVYKETFKVKLQPETKCILLVDLIDTTRTFKKILWSLQEYSIDIIDILSVLITDPDDREKRIRNINTSKVENKQQNINVHYLLEVKQLRHVINCPLCELSIPTSNTIITKSDLIEFSKEDDYMMIPSYDQWEICFENELFYETTPPSHRSAISNLINYPKILQEYGSWIANKISMRLKSEGFLPGTIIVTPDGGGSEIFTEYINLILEKQIVKIPHEIIDFCSSKDANINLELPKWRKNNPEWLQSLTNSGGLRIIIMEEFNITGTTFESIRKLLKVLTHQVVCFFPLNNLNLEYKKQIDIPLFTLYEWNYRENEFKGEN